MKCKVQKCLKKTMKLCFEMIKKGNEVKVCFAREHEGATIPTKRIEDAGMDIYPCFSNDYLFIKPHKTVKIATGIRSACPPEYYFQLEERGSTGSIGLALRCGVIDSGYRGEWFVVVTNTTDNPIIITKYASGFGDYVELKLDEYDDPIIYSYNKAIAQAVLLPVPKVKIDEVSVEELFEMKSERMDGCLGSSGK